MRTYLEAQEQTDADSDFVRLDVTGKGAVEQAAILASMKDFMSGVDCQFCRHLCYHDEGRPCVMEQLQ